MAPLENVSITDGQWTRIVIGLVVVTALTVSAYYRRQAGKTSGPVRESDGAFRLLRVIGLLFAAVLLTYLVAPGWVSWASLAVPRDVRIGGAVLSFVSLPLLVWVFRSLRGNVTPTSATRVDHELVTHGPYRWIRHPLYTFAAMFWTGICLLAANWFLLLLLAMAILGVTRRTPLEEQRLLDEFGDEYRAYMQRTGGYVPRLR